jgi:hypothetical protein
VADTVNNHSQVVSDPSPCHGPFCSRKSSYFMILGICLAK